MNKLFTMSESGKSEYCCNAVKIGEVKPIEGSDFLGQTFVNGASIVVRKDQVKEGDILFYASNECALNADFLSKNNLFDIDNYELNTNADEVRDAVKEAVALNAKSKKMVTEFSKLKKKALRNIVALEKEGKDASEAHDNLNAAEDGLKQAEEMKTHAKELRDEVKKNCGFFNKYGRVRCIKLKGCPSYGFLFRQDELATWCPKVSNINMEELFDNIDGVLVSRDFDTVDGELFVKAYVPPVKEKPVRQSKESKRQKKADKFDKMVEGEFRFHYDTQQLGKNLFKLNPDTNVVISNKLHGTSLVVANVKVKLPLKIAFYKRIWNVLAKWFRLPESWKVTDYVIDYGDVYSSRTVIKNQYINKDVSEGYYSVDIWGEYNELLKPFIPHGMTLYGEIVGYLTNSDKMVQKGYDYGCAEGENKLMIYRITTTKDDGSKEEWELDSVKAFAETLLKEHEELKEKVIPIPILYEGTLGSLYPDLNGESVASWQEKVLLKLQRDMEHFGMELDEPMCDNAVPREGIVLRINGDPIAEAFKLKTDRFFEREAKDIDEGNVDIEMQGNYGEGV